MREVVAIEHQDEIRVYLSAEGYICIQQAEGEQHEATVVFDPKYAKTIIRAITSVAKDA